MKVIVITKFKDKYTNKWHIVDEILSITAERYEEIKKFVKLINDDVNTKTSKKTSSKKNKANL